MQKRKTILNNLKNGDENLKFKFENKGGLIRILEKIEIQPNRRAESLTLDEWKKLINHIADIE
jgi:16S rRNA A1518/A1519 N6-dimethyltransferase RsmA/KsgA/DIM1 with predicted DNA glycosylase/AP lyase activity